MYTQLDDDSRRLIQLSGLIQASIADFVCLKHSSKEKQEGSLPSKPLFDARRNLLAAAGMLTELVSEPENRLIEVSLQYFESRALHIVADKRVPDILARSGDGGVGIRELASAVDIESRKLSRIMRCLCSIHIFTEIEEDVFANNAISSSLVANEPLRAYLLLFALDIYSSSDCLPKYLSDPIKGPSYAVDVTAWQDAIGTPKSRWDWLEEQVDAEDATKGMGRYPGVFGAESEVVRDKAHSTGTVCRPEHEIFGLSMLGVGNATSQAHVYDFPWDSLGSATVVDVGGGVGGFCIQLSRKYPRLNFIIQDRAPVLAQARSEVWPQQNPAALEAGRVQFTTHDFFVENPVRHADVYWLRYIIHDWSDDSCVQILSAIKSAMGPKSRILICDHVMNTTAGCKELAAAPQPLPANWGYFTRFSHLLDLTMMTIINGAQRKPSELQHLVHRAGLRLRKFWDCRSGYGLIEVVLEDSELQ